MCSWMAYSGDPVSADELQLGPEHSAIDRSLQAKLGEFTTNGGGFGVGWYGNGTAPALLCGRRSELSGGHLGYAVSGRLHVAFTGGSELDLAPGDAYRLEPGHDVWVIGNEPLVALGLATKTAETYATS